jgi:hypothetical protein
MRHPSHGFQKDSVMQRESSDKSTPPGGHFQGGSNVRIHKLGIGGFVTVLWVIVLGVLALPAFAAAPEAPETKAASGVTASTATLHGVLNPNVEAPAGWYFAYAPEQYGPACVDAFTAGGEPENPLVKFKAKPVQTELTGLEPHRKYTFCLVATNEASEAMQSANEETFETSALKPTVTVPTAAVLAPFEARLEGVVNPNNETTSCEFEYGTGSVTENKVACEQPSLEGFGEQGVGLTVKGLTRSTTYKYQLVATNTTGTTEVVGASTFTTLPATAPVIEAEKFQWLFSTTATVEAKVNPDYQETACEVRYWRQSEGEGAATKVPCSPTGVALGTGSTPVTVTAPLEPLTPGETYDYRVIATNSPGGETKEPVQPLQALDKPAVTTEAPLGTTATTATVAGTVNPYGAGTFYHVVYASQAGYRPGAGECAEGHPECIYGGDSTPNAYAGAGYAPVPAGPVELQNLTPGTTYHYAIVASNSEGSTVGPDETFTTAAAETTPPTPGPGTTGPAPVSSPFTLPAAAPFVPFTTVAQIQAKEAKERGTTVTTTTAKPLTKAQKRAKALKACKREKSKTARTQCEREAKQKYGAAKQTKGKK